MPAVFALVDCNNFYVSCERVFNPHLEGRPVVVLSNNDGCIIARSDEVKSLGIKMGEPYFRCKSLIDRNRIEVFSSNYALYGDMSQRVMDVLRQLEPAMEIYSIDEAFIRLSAAKKEALGVIGQNIKRTVRRQTGMPVSIGFGPTKTLAKIANRIAKKNPMHGGVFSLISGDEIDCVLKTIAVGDVWGIGSRSRQKLAGQGILTAHDLSRANEAWVRKNLSVTGVRTMLELLGVSCYHLEAMPPSKRSIACSRSFGVPVSDLKDIHEATASYVSRAAEKLREQHLTAGCLTVYLTTSRFRKDQAQYSNSKTVIMSSPTADTAELIAQASRCLGGVFRTGYVYQKVGVVLTDLVSAKINQADLFIEPKRNRGSLLEALDRINSRWGSDTLQYASAGLVKPWHHKQTMKSPSYTTNWGQLPVVNASSPGINA